MVVNKIIKKIKKVNNVSLSINEQLRKNTTDQILAIFY